jgi:hypothetical protein
MSNHEHTPPKFENDHDALVFLIEKYQFKGGWNAPAGMSFDADVEIDASAPPWAMDMALAFSLDLNCKDSPVFGMSMEYASCQLSRKGSKLILSRYWGDPLLSEGPCVLQPRALQKAIMSILSIKSPALGDVDPCEFTWTRDRDTGRFRWRPDGGFVLYDSEYEDITCNKTQAMKILKALRQPGMTNDRYWSCFKRIEYIQLYFSSLDGAYHYGISGTTKPEDITEYYLKSQEHCRP